jgi:hypothetical protein
MSPEKPSSNSGAADSSKGESTETQAATVNADPISPMAANTPAASPGSPADNQVSAASPQKLLAQKSAPTAKPLATATVVPPSKSAADKPSTPPPPTQPQPSMPVSMTIRPDSTSSTNGSALLPGELEETFETVLGWVKAARTQNSVAARTWAVIRKLIPFGAQKTSGPVDIQRMVAFDGFRNDLFEEKRERDRRYGTVYTVSEEMNAFLVRLELPRRMPKSSLKQIWQLADDMPDYACQVTLADGVLTIRAGLPDEARRRLSYVSPSFPSDFQTRLEFPVPVERYKYQQRNMVLEVIVLKRRSLNSIGS